MKEFEHNFNQYFDSSARTVDFVSLDGMKKNINVSYEEQVDSIPF